MRVMEKSTKESMICLLSIDEAHKARLVANYMGVTTRELLANAIDSLYEGYQRAISDDNE